MDSANHLEERPPGVYELALAEEEARRRRAIARLDEQAIAARVGGNRYLMAWYQGLHGGRQTIQPFDGGQGLLLDRLIGNVQISPLLPSPPHTSTYLPNLVDLDIYRGDDIDLRLVVTNQDGTPADLTVDTNVRAQIRAAPDDPGVLGSFIPTIDVNVPDVIRLKLPRTVTANLPPLCVWDCEVQQGKAAIPPVGVADFRNSGSVPRIFTSAMAVQAGEWLLAAVGWPVAFGQITDSAGNTWIPWYAPGFSPTHTNNMLAFVQCQLQNAITPGTTLAFDNGPGVGRIIWIPGAQAAVSDFAGATGSMSTLGASIGPLGKPGQMIVSILRSHAQGGTPAWTPASLTEQLGPWLTSNDANGTLLTGVNLPRVDPSTPAATWPQVPSAGGQWSLSALAYDVALPWTTTVVAGTIATAPDVTRY